MSDMSTGHYDGAGQYEICLRGHLESRWAAWFDGLTLTTRSDGTTILSGAVTDQAALHGLLAKVRNAGLTLISVIQLDPDQPTAPPSTRSIAP